MKFDTSIKTKKYHRGTNSKKYIMLHHTASNAADVNQARYLALHRAEVSCHYVVGKDGKIRKIADDDNITWHAGRGNRKGHHNTMNQNAIGIEVCSDGKYFTIAQLEKTTELVKHLMKQYDIPSENVIRHKDYAPGRKRDIGDSFRYPQFKTWQEYQQSLRVVPKKEINRDEEIIKYLVKKGIFNGDTEGYATRRDVALMLGRLHLLGVDTEYIN